MNAWQPIESAPKDGTEYLAYDGEKIGIVYWDKEYEAITCGYFFCVLNDDFTHWAPLPTPPEIEP